MYTIVYLQLYTIVYNCIFESPAGDSNLYMYISDIHIILNSRPGIQHYICIYVTCIHIKIHTKTKKEIKWTKTYYLLFLWFSIFIYILLIFYLFIICYFPIFREFISEITSLALVSPHNSEYRHRPRAIWRAV